MKLTIATKPGAQEEKVLALKELTKGTSAAPARAGLAAAGKPSSAFGGPAQSSRAARDLAGSAWKARWKTRLSSTDIPRHVLADGAHLLVQSGGWQVLDTGGQAVSSGQLGAGQVVLDATRGVVCAINLNGMLEAHDIVGGKRRFLVMLKGGEDAQYPLVLPEGDGFLLAGSQVPRGGFEQLDPAGRGSPQPVPTAFLQKLDIGATPRLGAGKLVLSPRNLSVSLEAPQIVAARSGAILAFAVPGALFFADQDLQVSAAYAIAGQPNAISLDETGRAHLIMMASNRQELLVISPSGELQASHAQPGAAEDYPRPPTIGFDHTVYLAKGSRLVALGAGGRERWQRDTTAPSAGLLITPSGLLLSSEGPELAGYDAAGKRVVLFEAKGERLCTAPVVTATGHLVVASERQLFWLEPA